MLDHGNAPRILAISCLKLPSAPDRKCILRVPIPDGRDDGFEHTRQYASFERVKQLIGMMEMRQGNHLKMG